MNCYFIQKKSQYDQYKKSVAGQIFLKNNLPDQVFKNRFTQYYFDEFTWCLSDEFMNDLKKLMKISNDDHVLMAVLDPNPEKYYYKNFDYYNWAVISSKCNSDEYYSLISKEPLGSPADTIVDNSETIVWLPTSMQWAIYGNSFSGLTVLGTNLKVDRKTAWRALNDEYLKVIKLNYEGSDFEYFKKKLVDNFSK
ncbi:MAG: hypothetical protein ABF651_07370 [Sporolactobacillus sp.]